MRTGAVDGAIIRRRKSWVAAGIGGWWSVERSETGCGIELREAVEGAIGESVGLPVATQFAEIMIEASILLRYENDVIQHAYCLRDVKSGGGGLVGIHGQSAGGGSLAGSRPAEKISSLGGSRGKLYDGAGGE